MLILNVISAEINTGDSNQMFFIAVLLIEIFFPLEVYFWPGELRGPCGPKKKFAKLEVCGMNFNRNLRNLRLFLAE